MELTAVARLVADQATAPRAFEAIFGPPVERSSDQLRYTPDDPRVVRAIVNLRGAAGGTSRLSHIWIDLKESAGIGLAELQASFGPGERAVAPPSGNPHRWSWFLLPPGSTGAALLTAEFTAAPGEKGSLARRLQFTPRRRSTAQAAP